MKYQSPKVTHYTISSHHSSVVEHCSRKAEVTSSNLVGGYLLLAFNHWPMAMAHCSYSIMIINNRLSIINHGIGQFKTPGLLLLLTPLSSQV